MRGVTAMLPSVDRCAAPLGPASKDQLTDVVVLSGWRSFSTGVDEGVDESEVIVGRAVVTEAEQLWSASRGVLRTQVPDATWKAWFEGIVPVDADDRNLVLAVPSSLVKERLEARYLALVSAAVADAAGRSVQVHLDVHTRTGHDDGHDEEAPPAPRPVAALPATRRNGPAPDEAPARADELRLNPRYTFEAFVIGASNRFAHAAALAVAERPAKSYNPLFIHGDSGLGKTHLLHGIGHYVREQFSPMRVRYVSTETFMNDFVDAIRTNSTSTFKRHYRECDVLLVDDIQFMENKEGLQEEFFHTFNHLHGAERQIVISSDRHPRSIATLEDRLRSRFEWGLITDVQPPELETRLAILRKKAEGERTHVPDEVLDLIATHVKDNIRELEGALIRVSAYASLNREPLTRSLAEKVLHDVLSADQPKRITMAVILEATAAFFGFGVDELCSTSRQRPLVAARQIGMYVCRNLTEESYPSIGRAFGGRDHTTVIHAVEKVTALLKERRQVYDQVTELITVIKAPG